MAFLRFPRNILYHGFVFNLVTGVVFSSFFADSSMADDSSTVIIIIICTFCSLFIGLFSRELDGFIEVDFGVSNGVFISHDISYLLPVNIFGCN